MTTNAIKGYGATLTFNSNTIGEIMSISGSRSRTPIEIFTCDSADQAKEFLAGALDEGEITFHLVYDGSDAGVYNDLHTDIQAGTLAAFTVAYSDTSTHAGTAMISSLGTPGFGDADGFVELDVTLRVSGKTTYTDVAA